MSFLPGMFPGAAGVLAEVTDLDFFASSTSQLDTVTLPANIERGDLIFIFDHARNGTEVIPTSVVPTGFTSMFDTSGGGDTRIIGSYKIAAGNESSQVVTGMDASQDHKVALVFRSNALIGHVTVADVASEVTDGNPAAQVCNASGGVVPLVVFGFVGSAGGPISFTFNPAADASVSSDTSTTVSYKIYTTAPADITVDMADVGGGNYCATCYVQVRK